MATKNLAETMWQSLEHEFKIPASTDIKYLSGLLSADIQRLSNVWMQLPVNERRKLTQTLTRHAELDFELDFSAAFRIALKDPDAEVRAAAIEGLFEDEDIRLVSQFSKILRKDNAVLARAKAAQALAHFVLLGELEKIRPTSFAKARTTLLEAYHDPEEDIEVQRRSVEALAYTALDGIPDLIATAYEHPDEQMRISAVFAMGRSADQRWNDIVLRELNNPLPTIRYEATRACGELRIQKAVRPLIELIEDTDTEIQQMAIWSLGEIGGSLAQRTLTTYLESDNEALSDAARLALDELEFFHGDLSSFFGPPSQFDGESDVTWDEEFLGDTSEEDKELWFN